MQVKIKDNGIWKYANPDQKQAFENYKNRPMYSQELPVGTNGLTVYQKNNVLYLTTYITYGLSEISIVDFDK